MNIIAGSSLALFAVTSNGGIIGAIVVIAAIVLVSLLLKGRKSEDITQDGSENSRKPLNSNEDAVMDAKTQDDDNEILKKENILLGLKSVEKEEAIKMAGRLLVDGGYTGEEYIQAMLEREEVVSTYIGNGVAIPHGVGSSKDKIKSSGIVVLQFPGGIDFNEGNKAHLVIGIAGKDNDHLKILSNIATSLEDEKVVGELVNTKEVDDIYKIFTSN